MNIFEQMNETRCRETVFFEEESLGLRAMAVIHDTTLGPALSNCIMYPYESMDAMIQEALDIAYFNTVGGALNQASLGGGSVILWGDPEELKSEMYLRALGQFLNRLNGRVRITIGAGIVQSDLDHVHKESPHVLGLPEVMGGSGDPSVTTAKGMLHGLRGAVKHCLDKPKLEKLRIVVQGLGPVGRQLVKELTAEGAILTVTDLVYDRIKEIQDHNPDIQVVKPGRALQTECDIFIVCARDRMITADNIDQLRCRILTGSVNRVVDDPALADQLAAKNITLVPGFLINSGYIIQLSHEVLGFDRQKTDTDLRNIYYTTLNTLQKGAQENQSVFSVALNAADRYLRQVASIRTLK